MPLIWAIIGLGWLVIGVRYSWLYLTAEREPLYLAFGIVGFVAGLGWLVSGVGRFGGPRKP
jgi:hypothetical protein